MFFDDWDDFVFQTKRGVVRYLDISRKTARKEFNLSILIYSLVLMVFLFLTFDFDRFDQLLQSFGQDIYMPMAEGHISEQQATQMMENVDTSFMPNISLNFFPLFLLPLYIRRINDTAINSYLIAPVVLVYALDFLKALFGFEISFFLLDLIGIYNFILVSALCIMPTYEEELEETEEQL